MKKGREQVEIIALYEELGSYRAVAAFLGCDHKTVKRYVELAGELGQFAPTRRRARVTDDYRGLIAERVERTRGGSRRADCCGCCAPRATRVRSARCGGR